MESAPLLDWKLSGPESAMSSTYTIGRLAQAAGVPASTVRYCEQRKLLAPDARTASRNRVYGPAAPKRLRFIRAAQASGFTLEDIGMLLEQSVEEIQETLASVRCFELDGTRAGGVRGGGQPGGYHRGPLPGAGS